MSLLARQSVVIARQGLRQHAQPVLRRNLHVENTVETVSHTTPNPSPCSLDSHSSLLIPFLQALPFKTGPKRKAVLAVGVTTFLSVGFSLPFVAAYFQKYVSTLVPPRILSTSDTDTYSLSGSRLRGKLPTSAFSIG